MSKSNGFTVENRGTHVHLTHESGFDVELGAMDASELALQLANTAMEVIEEQKAAYDKPIERGKGLRWRDADGCLARVGGKTDEI